MQTPANSLTGGIVLCTPLVHYKIPQLNVGQDRLCGLVVRIVGCKSRGTGLNPVATTISEK
jgi:hypothetical protein